MRGGWGRGMVERREIDRSLFVCTLYLWSVRRKNVGVVLNGCFNDIQRMLLYATLETVRIHCRSEANVCQKSKI